jgi:FkbM family methyltransferase
MTEDARPGWEPPWTLEERLKFAFVPTSLYMRYRTAKEMRRGEAEVALLPFLADPARVSLDIGANKGVYTWLLRGCSREVHAFEPNPKMFRFLSRLRGGNVHVSPIALSNESGQAVLRVPRHRRGGFSNQGASLSSVKVADGYEGVAIEARRLDDMDIADIGFIKIDVEGFEQAVLDGAQRTIARDRPVLLIEMEEAHTRQPIEDAIARVESLGYRGLFLNRGILHPMDAFDGDRHHRRAVSRQDYVFNFIFLPRQPAGVSPTG